MKRRGLGANPHHGALAHVPELALVKAIEGLLEEGRLAPRGKRYPTVWLPDKPVRAKKGEGTVRWKPVGLEAARRKSGRFQTALHRAKGRNTPLRRAPRLWAHADVGFVERR